MIAIFPLLFASIYFFGQGLVLLFCWISFNGNFSILENEVCLIIWGLSCLLLASVLGIYSRYQWTAYSNRERLPSLLPRVLAALPFLIQGIALLCYWTTRLEINQYEAKTAFIFGLTSLVLACTLPLISRIISTMHIDSHPAIASPALFPVKISYPEVWKSYGLTNQERHILELMVHGKANKEIAQALLISDQTVKVHIRHIFQKLSVSNRTEAVSKVLQHNLP